MSFFHVIAVFLRSLLRTQMVLAAENLALRQQLAVLEHSSKRPKLRDRDRIFWVWLSKLWPNWRSVLFIVQPQTVVRWHQQGFKLYWRWKSRPKTVGRPKIDSEVRILIRRLCRENPTWGAPRIHSELELLGYKVSETTVDKYMIRHRKLPSQTWRTFLDNHLQDIVAVDFFTIPSATFRILFVFLVLRHDRRFVVHFNITANPTAEWTAQQIVEAFPYDDAPRFLLRDRDSIYGHQFKDRIKNMGIEGVVTAARSPWQNPYVERIVGTLRRECLNFVIVLNERHLRRILHSYLEYYHEHRTHLSLNRNSPIEREVREKGELISIPMVGGLHHRYRRAA
jgi:putative transposase